MANITRAMTARDQRLGGTGSGHGINHLGDV